MKTFLTNTKFSSPLFIIFLVSILHFSSHGQCISNPSTGVGLAESNFGQSFTIPATGCGSYLESITLNRVSIPPADDFLTVTIYIYSGQSFNPANQIYTQSGIILGDDSGEKTIAFSGGTGSLAITPGAQYSFRCSVDGNIVAFWELGIDNYAGGQPYFSNNFFPSYDLYFKVTTSSSDPLLPVELMSFEAEKQNASIELTWQTASEENNAGFEVQRSNDGKEWEILDFVEGNGTTLEVQNYTYTDKAPLTGVNYYRLKQIDFDGKFDYSNIVNLETTEHSDIQTLIIYPNPIHEELNIVNGKGDVIIYNSIGQLVKEFTVSNEQFAINVSDLESGTYTLKIQKANGIFISKQFVKF